MEWFKLLFLTHDEYNEHLARLVVKIFNNKLFDNISYYSYQSLMNTIFNF